MFDPTLFVAGKFARKALNSSDSTELANLEEAGTAFVSRITGAPATELGEWFADQVRYWRFKSQLRILDKAREQCEQAGISPQTVKPNVLVPLLESASLEDDDSLVDRWAALLANAANEETAEQVSAGYVDVLRQLDPMDASILQNVYRVCALNWRQVGLPWTSIIGSGKRAGVPAEEMEIAVGNLERLGLVTHPSKSRVAGLPKDSAEGGDPQHPADSGVFLTAFGCAFLKACTPPEPIAGSQDLPEVAI